MTDLHRPQVRNSKAKFANVSDVLDKVTQGLSLDRRLREHALKQIWPTLVGEPFGQKSRVLFVDSEDNIVVAVSDASCAQEMSFSKRTMLTKIYPAARALGLKIKGMRFDLKHYFNQSETALENSAQTPNHQLEALAGPLQDEINRINLEEAEISQVQELTLALQQVEELKITSSNHDGTQVRQLSARITKIVEHQLRLESWRRSQNYPNCSKCSYPTAKLHTESRLCAQCYLKKLAGDDQWTPS